MRIALIFLALLPQDRFPAAEQAARRMTVASGFEVTVFAAEPEIGQPIAFCFDERGRLWVAENLNYRNRGNHVSAPSSRIAILTDADNDGRFDQKKVFAEKLPFLSALAVGMGGAWVGSPPHLLFFPDADGDDRPDGPPRPMLDGWGIDDRHETLNSLVWGPDGWLYGCQGVFTHSNVGKPGAPNAERQKIDGGIWRFHPTKQRFEVFAHGLSNPWGLDFDDHGQAFATACVIPHLWHIVQGGYYQRQAGGHPDFVYEDLKTIRDHAHQSAHGGARVYLADAFPAQYRGRLFMCNIHEHNVLTDILERRGSGFVGRHGDQVMAANDKQWVGFSVEIGHEGAVYVLDWHDEDICGNAVRQPDTGRVYRIFPKDGKRVPPPNLRAMPDAELVKLQRHPNDWYVRQARLLLQHRAAARKLDKSVPAQLQAMLKAETTSPLRLRALWALHAVGGLTDAAALAGLLDHADEYVRAWAIQLLCEDMSPSAAAQKKMAAMAAADKSTVVRLYLAAALQRMPAAGRWPVVEALVKHEEDAEDHNIPLMIWYGTMPLVSVDKPRSLKLAAASRIPKVRQFISRRVTGDDDDD